MRLQSRCGHLKAQLGLEGLILRPTCQADAGYWQGVSVPQLMDLFLGLLGCPHDMMTYFLQNKSWERAMSFMTTLPQKSHFPKWSLLSKMLWYCRLDEMSLPQNATSEVQER